MKDVKLGSLWNAPDGKYFRVIGLVDHEGQTWIHYREDLGIKVPTLQCREYSCYLESFVSRFNPLPE
jgi:hypothetical protein